MKRRPTVPALCLVAALLAPAAAAPQDVDLGDLEIGLHVGRATFSLAKAMRKITPEDEHYLGRAVAAEILARYPVYDDPEARRYLERVGGSLALASERTEVYGGYHFVLLDADEVNAFACPGAFVFVTRGMLRATHDEDTLAAVRAHEIAHLEGRHGLRLIKEKRWKKFLAVVGTGAVAGTVSGRALRRLTAALGGMAEGLFVTLYKKGYGKKLEKEADALAAEILERAGYDPHALGEMLTAMERQLDRHRGGFGRTHPKPGKRMRMAREAIPEEPSPRPEARTERYRAALERALAP